MEIAEERPNSKPVHRSLYNMDSLINVSSSMDEEQQEVEKKQNCMLVSSIDCLFSDPILFDSFPLPIGVIVHLFSHDSEKALHIQTSPVRCENCGGIASNLSDVESNGCWKCTFCSSISSEPYNGEYSGRSKEVNIQGRHPELAKDADAVEYRTSAQEANVLYSPTLDTRAIIFVIDKSLTTKQFLHIQDSLSVVFSSPSLSHYYIGLIVFGDVIEIYELGGQIGEADVYSGSHLPSSADEQYIRIHEREGSDRNESNESFASYLAPFELNQTRFLDILSTFTVKEERIHPISILTFLTATRYAELLFSTGVFASGQIVVCTQGFFYELPSDPYLRLSAADDIVESELLHQCLFCYQNHLVIDAYISGCMYNSIHILKSLITPSGGTLLLLADSFQSDFINCVMRSLDVAATSATLTLYVGEGLEIERVLGTYMSSSVKRYRSSSVMTVELGRVFRSTAVSFLLAASAVHQPFPWSIPVQVEVTYKDLSSGQIVTRLQTCQIQGTEDQNQFLSHIDGYTTAVLIAKDVCSNLDTSAIVTENVKYGIDYLLSQIISFYRQNYVQPIDEVDEADPTNSAESDPHADHTHQRSHPTLSLHPLSPPPLPVSSPPPMMATSPSYSSFYSYTRTMSQNDLTTLVDPFDTLPVRSFSPIATPTVSSPTKPQSQSRWSWLLSFFSRATLPHSSRSSLHMRSQSASAVQSLLPPSLRGLPLYLYALHRGCLFGDCLHNGDLLQLHRLRLASASLQDSLRIILPRLILGRSGDLPLHRIYSVPTTSPPPTTPTKKAFTSEMISVGSMPLLPVQSTPSVYSVSPSVDECPPEYIMFVAEDEEEKNPYYLEKKLMGSCSPDPHAEFLVLPPETLALMSDSIIVLDTQREIFIWIGADRVSLEVDQVYDSCLSLALSMNQNRFPPSMIRVVKEGSSNARYVLSYLIPSHKDPIEVSLNSLPVLATLPPPYLKQHCNKFLRTDDMSFREYMVKIYHFKCHVC